MYINICIQVYTKSLVPKDHTCVLWWLPFPSKVSNLCIKAGNKKIKWFCKLKMRDGKLVRKSFKWPQKKMSLEARSAAWVSLVKQTTLDPEECARMRTHTHVYTQNRQIQNTWISKYMCSWLTWLLRRNDRDFCEESTRCLWCFKNIDVIINTVLWGWN